MDWPALKKATFISIGNYFKRKKGALEIARMKGESHEVLDLQEHLNNGILRSKLYQHMKQISMERGRLPFVKGKIRMDGSQELPREQMPWKYVDELKADGFLMETKEPVIIGNKRHYWFRMTEKGQELFRKVQFGMIFGPDDSLELIDDPRVRERVKKKMDKLMDKGFPFGKRSIKRA